MTSKFWELQRKHKLLHEAGFGHEPPRQEFGDMLRRSIRNRMQSCDGKRICACWCIVLVLYVRVCVYLRISVE